MQHETVATPPSQGGVFCSPPLARAHVDCRNYRRQTGYKYISCSQTTGAGAHAREAIADRAAYFKAWRTAKFGDDFDPVSAAVDEAVAAFAGAASRGSRPLALLALLGRPLTRANLGRSRRARANLENLDERATRAA